MFKGACLDPRTEKRGPPVYDKAARAADLEKLWSALEARGAPVTPVGCDRILKYLAVLEEWSPKINLVGPKEFARIVARHLGDSLLAWVAIMQACRGRADLSACVDIGSGAGFPGLAVAAAWDVGFTLVESDGRKAGFLTAAAEAAGIQCVKVENRRWEAPDPGRTWSLCVSRAVFADWRNLKGFEHRLTPGGGLWLWRSDAWSRDLAGGFLRPDLEETYIGLEGESRRLWGYLKRDKKRG